VASIGAAGILQELRGTRALVSVGGKRLWVTRSDLRVSPSRMAQSAPRLHVDVDDSAPGELVLLGMDSESAREELERFLDRALAAGRSTVRVVHGHGTGVLRRMVRDLCTTHPAVSSFRHPPQHFGGTGATEVKLEDGSHGSG